MLSIGIVGLPNVGKSTLFNALTQKGVAMENFPFCTIDPSVGVVAVPDERIDKLAEFSKSEKRVPAAIEFVDIAGLVKGASVGEGLGNKFLQNIREVDAIAEVVRIFDDPDVTHVSGGVDPVADIGVINLELIMADLETVTKRQGSIQKEVKAGDKDAKLLSEIMERLVLVLESGSMASTLEITDEEEIRLVKTLHLLTMKPVLYVINRKSGSQNLDDLDDERWRELFGLMKDLGAHYVVADAGIEQQLSELEARDKEEFRKELLGNAVSRSDDGVNNLVQEGYKMLGLMSYFTTGEDETRGWTVKEGSTAPEAGAAIHTDFQTKFIRADVINWQTLLDSGSYSVARDNGLVRTEGKDYIVQDGDVIEFKV